MSLSEFAEVVRSHDGLAAFNEESRFAMDSGEAGRVELIVSDGPQIVAAAFAAGAAPVELAVHPAHRRRGHATALIDQLARAGEVRFWAHGDLPAARQLASSAGLAPARTLLQLRWTPRSLEAATTPPDVVIRAFEPKDVDDLLSVNSRAFADHPEQGALDRAGFERRTQSAWFDPAGLFVAERGGAPVGFHWTKVADDVGEVYVLGVDPTAQGLGIATALLTVGLDYLRGRGVRTVELYVEGDNSPALALYEGFGFVESARDVLYVSKRPAGAAPGPA